MKKVFVDERFGDVVVGAFAQGRDRRVNGRVGGHHDDERFGVNVFDVVEEREAVHAGHAYVCERDGHVLCGERFEGFLCTRSSGDAVARLFQQARDDRAHKVFIFGDEDEWLCAHYLFLSRHSAASIE